jgi:hypothetical protein
MSQPQNPGNTIDNALKAFGSHSLRQALSIGDDAFSAVSNSIFEASSHAHLDTSYSPEREIVQLRHEIKSLKQEIFTAESLLNDKIQKIAKLKEKIVTLRLTSQADDHFKEAFVRFLVHIPSHSRQSYEYFQVV